MDSRQWSNAEIFELCAALKTMSMNLAHLVAKVKDGGVNLADASERISEAASEIETVAVERAVKLGELSGTINAISKSVDLLNADAVEAAKNVASSLKIVGDGEKLMGRLDENISGLLEATESVAARLAIIKDKTDKIFAVVSTINAVGNRTNTLALSAALEAERAGESAEGFSAVAVEIGKLADRTAVSSMHVSKMASDMLESVESGVAEIESFAAGMRAGFMNMARVSDSVASTRERVSELEPKFELLARGISVHAESASNIRFAVRDLSAAASRTRESIGNLKELTDSISETSETLKDKVSRFRLPRA